MENLNLVPLNLQQTLVIDQKNRSYDPVIGVHDKHKQLLMIRFTSDMIVGKTNKMVFNIKTKLESEGFDCKHVLFGDGFTCDTWDKKVSNFDIKEYVSSD